MSESGPSREERPAVPRRLVYLGPGESGEDGSGSAPGPLRCEGRVVAPGSALELVRRRSPWSPSRPVLRVILGRHPARADVLLEAPDLGPEHARLYLSRDSGDVNDLRAITEGTVSVNGRTLGHEWCALHPGDEVRLGRWRFRFERGGARETGTESE